MHYHVIIPCYNRPESLKRLLLSLIQSQVPNGCHIDITFSVDGPFEPTEQVIHQFKWPWGSKHIIVQPKNQGIQLHMFCCLELGINHKWNIILEDDLWVTPIIWEYLSGNITQFETMGFHSCALYYQGYLPSTLHLRQNNQAGFHAVQYPCSSGFMVSGQNLSDFLAWKSENHLNKLPFYMDGWTDSWKKIYAAYLIATQQYVLYPPASVTTNFGDAGVHHKKSSRFFQSPLMLDPAFLRTESPILKYDCYFNLIPEELKGCIPELGSFEFEVDLSGDKPPEEIKAPYLLSVRPCSSALFQWSDALKPIERNLQFNLKGQGIQFGKTRDFDFTAKRNHFTYMESILPPKWKRNLAHYLIKIGFQ